MKVPTVEWSDFGPFILIHQSDYKIPTRIQCYGNPKICLYVLVCLDANDIKQYSII